MTSKVIGIISYLPDEPLIREKRFNKLQSLVGFCRDKFRLPIIVIAQNWDKDVEIEGCKIYRYPSALGIVEARKELRRIFLLRHPESWLIMLDDDCTLTGSQASVDNYLNQINSHPGMFGEFNTSLLKLFAIHRGLLSQIDFDLIRPEDGDGFEDRIFVNRLRKQFPNKRFVFAHNGLEENSVSTADPLSTWYKGQNLSEMLDKTQKHIDEIPG